MKISEEELAEKIIAWLQDMRWEVYQEVQIHSGGSVADIVAVQGPLSWIIETKTSLSVQLLGQADRWRGYANFVSIAVPRSTEVFPQRLLQIIGVGLITVKTEVYERLRPAFLRKLHTPIRNKLVEAHKTFAKAGNANGHRWTPFQQTAYNVQRYVIENPDCSMKDLVSHINYHYNGSATARACLTRWIEAGIIKGVTAVREGRSLNLRYSKEKA
jgi:hypothetical protein